jgi:hypothetical protein
MMKAIPISNKTTLVRHWFKWYRVERGAADWKRVKVEARKPQKSIEAIAKALNNRNNKKRQPKLP